VNGQDHQLDEMYRDIILDHYRSPRGKKEVDNPDIVNEGMNPSCGDEIEMKVKLNGDVVEELGVHCAGCAISVASGSMLSEIAEGKTISELKEIASAVKGLLTNGEFPEELDLDEYGDIGVLEGVKKFPVRIKCALLAWVTLVEGLERQKGEQAQSTTE
jgi:nitrogen fixation NifU-like protein